MPNRNRRTDGALELTFAWLALPVLLAAGFSNSAAGQCGSGGFLLPPSGAGPYNTQQCFPDASGPAFWTDPATSSFPTHTSQVRTALQSPSSTSHTGALPTGSRPNCGGIIHPPAGGAAPTISLRLVGRRVVVDYEAPNYYCQDTGDWPPAFTYVNDVGLTSDHLILNGPGGTLAEAFIYYEKGTWDTGIDLACGGSGTYSAQIAFAASVGSLTASSGNQLLTAPSGSACTTPPPDHRSCPAGGLGGSTGVAQPINVGSGDVTTTIPLFTLAQLPLSLSFSLTYHSSGFKNPSLVSSPMGLGWTHPFAQTLRPVPSTNILYHVTADGYESEYTQSGAAWNASSPGELRGAVVADAPTSEYRLQDLDGTVTGFDQATGRWKYTKDRWNNQITGTYTGSNLTTVTDSTGRVVGLAYNGANQVQTITLPDGQFWQFGYQGSSLISIRDPLHTSSNWRNLGYQNPIVANIPLIISITDDAGALLEGHSYGTLDRGITSFSASNTSMVTVAYDTPLSGWRTVTSQIDATTNQVSTFSLTYQAGRWLPLQIIGPCTTCSGAGSDTQSFTYTADNHLSTATDGKGNVTARLYNADGNVTTLTEAQGSGVQRVTTYAYAYAPWPNFWTTLTQPSAAKTASSKSTVRALSGAGETTLTVTETGYLLSTDGSTTSYTTTQTFDAAHRLLTVTDPRSNATTYAYYAPADGANQNGRLKTVTDALSFVTTYTNYDNFGVARSVTDPNGVQTQLVTDTRGRVTSSTAKAVSGDPNEPTDYVTTYAFDSRDRLTKVTLPRGNATSYAYQDGTNRLTDTIRVDAGNLQQERLHLTLNIIGSKIQEEAQKCSSPGSSCAGWTQTRSDKFVYDTKNRLSQIVHPVPLPPDSTKATYAYDANGLLATVQDERHASANTLYAYDALNRLSQVQQVLAGAPGGYATTSYAYDAQDNLTQVTDPNGNLTTYAYDDFRRLQKQISPVSGTTNYSYDFAGNLTSTSDGNNATTTRTYDALNRVSGASSSRSGLTTESVTYTYDDATAGKYGKGRLSTMTDPTGSVAYAYDRRGLLRSENRIISGAPFSQAYGYDANGNRSSVTYPSGRVVAYTFDFADRPVAASSGGTNYVTAASYAPFGPATSLSFGNATTRSASFDLRYRPATLALTGASSTVSYSYGVDALGNITSITDSVTAAYSRTFGYDDLNRLTSATTGTGGSPPLWGSTGTYTYDSLGNRKTMNLGARSVTYTYEAVSGHDTSRLWSVSEGSLAVRHDSAGNEYQFGSTTSAYSPRNFLASTGSTSYGYDGRGLRVLEQSPSGGSLLYTITPCRIFDTRNATGPYGGPSLGAGATRAFTIWGQCGIPASGPRAIALNLTAVSPPGTGSLTLFPSDVSLPGTSSISVKPGVTRANNGVMGLSAAGSISLYNGLSSSIDMILDVSGYFADAPPSSRFFFYSPEMNLLSETAITENGSSPTPLYEYVWFGGRPIAQETVGASATRWTMTDHLGTPFLQTASGGSIVWRTENEPFGRVYAYTAGSAADPQPLRFPGQEERSTSSGRSYNLFRWYRSDVGQYTQPDPVELYDTKGEPYAYARGNPVRYTDPTGEQVALPVAPIMGGAVIATCLAIPACNAAIRDALDRCSRIRCRLAYHGPHHTFPGIGRRCHIQLTCWLKGIKGSGWSIRIPVPCLKGENSDTPDSEEETGN